MGMIRCRECRGLLAEPKEQDEFELAPQVQALVKQTCARCGTPLEPGVDDCPNCASAMLDDFLKGPEKNAQSTDDSEKGSAARPARPAPEWAPLREVDSTETDDGTGDNSTGKPAEPATRSPLTKPAAGKAGNPQKRPGSSGQRPAPAKASEPAKGRSSIDDDPPGLFDDDVPAPAAPARPKSTRPAPAPAAAGSGEPSTDSAVETTAACTALLASLATADTTLRIEIATALGKLGDKTALGPLERHFVDKDVRVRRAVAAALIQLGHPKGQSLLDIAERKPAAPPPAAAMPAAPKSKPKSSGGGPSISGAAIKKLVLGIVAIGAVSGGAWYFMFRDSSSNSRPARKPKKAKTKKAAAANIQLNHIAQAVSRLQVLDDQYS